MSGLLLITTFSYLDPIYYSKLHLIFGIQRDLPTFCSSCFQPQLFCSYPQPLWGEPCLSIGKALANENHSAGSPLGLLYGVNTFGGVTGVIGATFFLLGTAGASLTLAIVSIVNTLIGLVALLVFGKIVRIAPVDSNPDTLKI